MRSLSIFTLAALTAAAPSNPPTSDTQVPISKEISNTTGNETINPNSDFQDSLCNIFHDYMDPETRKLTKEGIDKFNEMLKLHPLPEVEAGVEDQREGLFFIGEAAYDVPGEIATEEFLGELNGLEGGVDESEDEARREAFVKKYELERYKVEEWEEDQ